MSADSALIINAAITGTVFTRSDSAALPLTMEEIVECALHVREQGASIIHLHARNPDQSPSYDPGVYRELVEKVRRACGDMIVCVSLSGRFVSEIEKRAAALAAEPDMASLTLGSMNFSRQPSINAPDTIVDLAERIRAAGAVPELEVFEPGFINYAVYLIRKGVLRVPFYFNLILGSLGTAPLDPAGLGYMLSLLPPGATWALGGLGGFQLDANVMAVASGGHVRVGLEDNLWFDRGKTDPADNGRLVARIARIAREMGREPATPAEAREIIGLPPCGS
jgi:3-keto-5-aminohexanoate cleavage enzyme